ncbi:LysR family transcriptional regulator [Nocardia sp. NRRL S-836]|nr:LysR family transcriptional regulator [Nocardia sp. NRRL S-836]
MVNKVELRHLRYFATVAETCHFGHAAKRLSMAQPALSHAIRQLEKELGVCLLARTTRRVELTEAGKFFLDEALHTLNRLDAGIQGVRLFDGGRSGLVRVGFTAAAAFGHLPLMVQAIRKKLPGLEFEIHSDLSSQEQCDKLREETLDLGVVHPPLHHTGVELLPLCEEPLIAVFPSGHPLAEKASLDVDDLRDESFVTEVKPDPGIDDEVMKMCLNAGFSPRRKHVAPNLPTLLALVAAGLGIGLVPESARAVPMPGTACRHLRGAATVTMALAWHRSQRSQVVANVVKAFDAYLPAF